ncbi:MAG: filamentous hemagglutinin, partial [Pleurocapsa sp. MO_192.B19]|nr:filamentous hemagglutinin [Pleurocapsa sp. MO_192.B19]
ADAGSIEINTGQLSISNGGVVVASTLSNGDGGDIKINATKLVELKGVFDINNPSSIVVGSQRVETSGDAGDLQIFTPQLTVSDGAAITANTLGQGDGGNIEIDANDTINVINNGIIAVSGQGQGNAGELNIQADSLTLENGSSLAALTSAGDGGSITLQIDDDLTLRDNSTISAQALQDANGGNLDIDARFIVAFPSNGNDNDIIASAEQGDGGDITINAESLFGIAEGVAIEGNNINDIDASSEFGLSGDVSINTPDVNAIQADIELPDNIVESQETIAQACQSDRLVGQVSSLTIQGRGGIPPQPIEPIDSDIILVNGKTTTPKPQVQSLDIKPIKTSIGDILPAKGVIKTEDGQIILTAYSTDKIATRTPPVSPNCSGRK